MAESLQARVRARAGGRCEYCHVPEAAERMPFQLDHIIAESRGGRTSLANSAWACLACNKRKGPNIAGRDKKTGRLVPLFHPRRHQWHRHFRWDGPILRGRTPIGRATIMVLKINAPFHVELRRTLIDEGAFPLDD